MPHAQVHVLIGPARSGKTARLLAAYRRQLQARPPGGCLWLAPTQRSALEIRRQLLDDGRRACLSPGVMTFDQLAQAIVAAADEPMRPLGAALKRHLLRQVLAEAQSQGKLQALAPIAGTPGLVDELASWISELKRHEVWPEHLAEALGRGRASPHQRELAVLYARYQEHLLAHQLYDAEGQFWAAHRLAAAGQSGPLSAVRYLVADGFTDFTHTQHKILNLASGWLEELCVALPWHEEPPREQLFTKTVATLARFRGDYPRLEVSHSRSEGNWPALDVITRELFADPRRPAVSDAATGVEVRPAASALAEIQDVARQIKRLLIEGDPDRGHPVAPGDVVVVLRRLDDTAALVREVFAEYGLPAAIEAGRPLRDAPLLAALCNLVNLDVEDWPYERLLATLANSYFQPRMKAAAAVRVAAEWCVRDLQLPRGAQALLASMQHRAAPAPTLELPSEEASRRRQHAATAESWFCWLRDLLGALPRRASLVAWTKALAEVVEGSVRGVSLLKPWLEPLDKAAWLRLHDSLLALGELAERIEPGQTCDRREFAALLSDIVAREQLPADHDETGRVRVLGAASVRTLRVPYLFVAGLAEKDFPAPTAGSRLCSELDHAQLIWAGLRLAPRGELAAEEMLLFYEVVTRATRRLTLSYPAWDGAGQPLLASPYVLEMQRLFAPQLTATVAPELSPLPPTSQPYSPAEWRTLAVAAALNGEPQPLAAVAASEACGANLLAALESIAERGRFGEFSRYEGLLSSPTAHTETAKLFAAGHIWNATELEKLAACPFRFFGERVLGLVELPDLELDTDHRRRGSVLHDLLARLHTRINDAAREPALLSGLSPTQLDEWIEQLLAELLHVGPHDATVEGALKLVDRTRLAADLSVYRQRHLVYEQSLTDFETAPRPTYFEVSFGLQGHNLTAPSTTAPLELDTPAGSIKVAGRIDRIDLGQAAGQTVATVIDYKSGKLPATSVEHLKNHNVLQLPLYAWAVEGLLLTDREAAARSFGYWGTAARSKQGGFARVADLAKDDSWSDLKGWIATRIGQLVQVARNGDFRVVNPDPDCTAYCALSTVCRVRQARNLEKTWTLPSADRA